MSGDLERVDYAHGETKLTGWLARPEGTAKGALVVFPTIANMNAPVERRARMFAEAGYLTLIADFYGEPVADFEHARALASELRSDPQFYRVRLASALETLRTHPEAADLKLVVVGYCMGGGAALELARAGEDIAAAVSFHGLLETPLPAKPGAIKGCILVCHGDADPMVPRHHVIAFWEEMDRAGADWHFHSYSGVRHGFTDPGSDERDMDAVAYDASADRQSWAAALEFLDDAIG